MWWWSARRAQPYAFLGMRMHGGSHSGTVSTYGPAQHVAARGASHAITVWNQSPGWWLSAVGARAVRCGVEFMPAAAVRARAVLRFAWYLAEVVITLESGVWHGQVHACVWLRRRRASAARTGVKKTDYLARVPNTYIRQVKYNPVATPVATHQVDPGLLHQTSPGIPT